MEESTLRWPTDKECEEMEEVCFIGEVPLAACRIPQVALWQCLPSPTCHIIDTMRKRDVLVLYRQQYWHAACRTQPDGKLKKLTIGLRVHKLFTGVMCACIYVS